MEIKPSEPAPPAEMCCQLTPDLLTPINLMQRRRLILSLLDENPTLDMRFLLFSVLSLITFGTLAQPILVNGSVCLDIEVTAVHTEGPLEGQTTYRLYVTLPGPEDVVTTVFGDAQHPTALLTSTSWYQANEGGQFPCANNPLLFDLFPELPFDSWLTIGIDGPPDSGAGEDCPQVVMSTGSPFATEFENGQGFVIDDLIGSAWFVVPTNTNGLPDEDGRVLVAQLTTDGDLDGVLYLQVLPGGLGTLAQIVELPLYGVCDEIDTDECPEAIAVVELDSDCAWAFEAGEFQLNQDATWTFGDEVVNGGHYAEHVFGGDGTYPVSVAYISDLCPQGVTLETTVTVTGCTEPDCGLELEVQTAQEGEVIMVIPLGYPEGVTLVYSLNGEVFMEGGTALTLPVGTGDSPWQVCVQYITDDCPEGVVACTGSEGYESDCPEEVWVSGNGCEFVVSVCEFTEGEAVTWDFGDGTTGEGHFSWHVFPVDGFYETCATYVSPTCPDSTVLCVEVEVEGCEPCLAVDEGALIHTILDEDEPCLGFYMLEMMQPDDYTISWDFGDGMVFNSASLWTEHQHAESGTYQVCATVYSPGCPEGTTWCMAVEIEGCASSCEPVYFEVTPANGTSGYFMWEVSGENWAQEDILLFLPGVQQTLELGMCLPEGCYDVSLLAMDSSDAAANVAIAGSFDFTDDPVLDGAALVFSFGAGEADCGVEVECNLEIEALEESDGSWTLVAITDADEAVDFLWTLSDGSVVFGDTVNYTFVEGVLTETACVSATFLDCGEVLSACIDLENGSGEPCEQVEVTIEGETAEALLEDLEWTLSLWGEGMDWTESISLDPEGAGLDGVVLCLPPGCYSLSMAFSGSSEFEGLPGMTLTLNMGEADEIQVDLSLIDGVFDVEFGVLTDCSNGLMDATSPISDGLLVFPNPTDDQAFVRMNSAFFKGEAQWMLVDGLGRVVKEGRSVSSQWVLHAQGLDTGGYVLHVQSGVHAVHRRVMVTR